MSRAEGSRVDLETWGRKAGTLVHKATEIEAAVESSLADPGATAELRHAMVRDLFYNPGQATAAAFRWLDEHLITPAAARERGPFDLTAQPAAT